MTNFTPKHQTTYSAGADLVAAEETVIMPNETVLVSTGYFIPKYFRSETFGDFRPVFMLAARSSIAYKKGLILMNGLGILDIDYEQEVRVMYRNLTNEPVTLEEGERIAQIIPMGYIPNFFEVIDKERTGGFGHSGK